MSFIRRACAELRLVYLTLLKASERSCSTVGAACVSSGWSWSISFGLHLLSVSPTFCCEQRFPTLLFEYSQTGICSCQARRDYSPIAAFVECYQCLRAFTGEARDLDRFFSHYMAVASGGARGAVARPVKKPPLKNNRNQNTYLNILGV